MDKRHQVFKKYRKVCEKQDFLNKITALESIEEFGYSELHCIDAIGIIEKPNVAQIAQYLDMTTGAISKICKKLIAKGALKSFKKEENQKEIYFRLTEKGIKLFDEHKIKHEEWENKDLAFLQQFDETALKHINDYLRQLTIHLDTHIKEATQSED